MKLFFIIEALLYVLAAIETRDVEVRWFSIAMGLWAVSLLYTYWSIA